MSASNGRPDILAPSSGASLKALSSRYCSSGILDRFCDSTFNGSYAADLSLFSARSEDEVGALQSQHDVDTVIGWNDGSILPSTLPSAKLPYTDQ